MARPAKSSDPEDFYRKLKPPQREIALELRSSIIRAGPKLKERIMWGMPWFVGKEKVFCLMTTGQRVNLGFWRGVELTDPSRIVEGTGKSMRHVKVTSVAEARSPGVRALVRQAVALDR